MESCSRPKHTLLSRLKPREFLLECAQPTGGNVSRFSMSLRGPGLATTRSILAGMNERWKIARDSSAKASGGIKAGDKVTITCTVTATEIESS